MVLCDGQRWLAPFAQAGDTYMIDDVRLEVIDRTESPLPGVSSMGIMTAKGVDTTITDTLSDGSIVDEESAVLETFLPVVKNYTLL